MVVGLIKCTEALGASFSNLTGEMIAHYAGYEAAFLFLCLLGLTPMIIYIRYMPDTSRSSDQGGLMDISKRSANSMEPVSGHTPSTVDGSDNGNTTKNVLHFEVAVAEDSKIDNLKI